jgi:membrane protein implicated in regulation of membrane protease activity
MSSILYSSKTFCSLLRKLPRSILNGSESVVKLSPRAKFILVTIDELLLVPILILGSYFYVPDLLQFTIVATILGASIFVAVKYRLIYDSLKEGSYYLYDLKGIRCKAIEVISPSSGKVKIGAEIWEARSDAGEILVGTEVVVVSRENMKVHVKPWHGESN